MDGPQPDVRVVPTGQTRRAELIAAGLTLLAGLAIIAGTVAWRYGSAEAALIGGNGRSIAPDTPMKSLGDVVPEETSSVAFTLRNLTGHPIRIQGAQTSCTCTVVEGIPCVIEARDAQETKGVVRAGSEPGRFDGSFVLYTDDDGEPEVRLGYTGRVIDTSG